MRKEIVKNTYRRVTYRVEVTTSNKELGELYEHIRENIRLEYFLKCQGFIGENWIDFETEISRVIQSLDELRGILKRGDSYQDVQEDNQRIIVKFFKTLISLRKICGDVDAIDSFTILLNTELERLIRALEIYISKFVEGIKVTITNPDIKKLDPDPILSFNYSNTYEKRYSTGKNIEYAYIHGKADISKNVKTSNLVLGIDEYLDDGEKIKN